MLTPSSVAQFCDALGHAESNVTLHDEPTAWIDSNTDQILAVITKFQALPIGDLSGTDMLMLPRLTVYTLACVTLHTEIPSLLRTLKANISKWLSMDPVTQLTSYKSIQETLLYLISQCTGEDSLENNKIKNIFRLDTDIVAARFLVMLDNDEYRRQLVTQKDKDAQALLDILQELLDLAHLSPIHSRVLTTLLVLARRSGLYPKSLVVQGVERQGTSPVAGGSFGDVWKGKVKDEVVAIKVLRGLDLDARKRTHEAVLWKQLCHPNVLAFYGLYTWEQGPRSSLCLVSPWAEHGNVVEYLRKNPEADRTRLLFDFACGLEYLHNFNPPVVHGDLKGTNILVTSSLRACIADFGLCTLTKHHGVRYTSSSSLGAGALLYRAPELLNRSQQEYNHRNDGEGGEWMTLATDIYSFGCTCYELFTGHPRFYNLGVYDAIVAVRENRALEKPFAMDDALWRLMQTCWRVEPSSRPTALDIVQDLRSQLEDNGEVVHRMSHTTTKMPNGPSTTSLHSESDELIHNDMSSDVGFSTDAPITGTPVSPRVESSELLENSQQVKLQTVLLSTNTVSSLTLLPDDKGWTVTKSDIIIAIMGPSGTGKTSFIKHAMPNSGAVVGHGVESCTKEVGVFACLHPNGSGRRVVLVDTPGFDDTERTDYEILENISRWLNATYKEKVNLSGILHFHSIAENRMKGRPRKNLEMFQYLCGNTALGNVILTTTHWDRVADNVASSREAELKSSFWKPFIDKGSRVTRFYPSTYDSAWSIINLFNDTPHRTLRVQKEMVDQGKALHETSAFKFLVRWWKNLLKRANGMVRGGKSVPSERELQKALRDQGLAEGSRAQGATRSRRYTIQVTHDV